MIAVVNADIYTGDGQVYTGGTILVENGKIAAFGTDIDIPQESEVMDAEGAPVTPGLVEAHGHVGVSNQGMGWEGSDTNESTDPVTSQVSALDGINPEERGFRDLLRGGVTTVQVMPGSANIIGGEAVTIKAKPTPVVDEVILKRPTGMKSALGENPKRAYGRRKKDAPMTRMGSAAMLREWLRKARDYHNDEQQACCDSDADKNEGRKGKYDARLEALGGVIRGEVPLRIHAHRADDIVTAVRIAEEFGIKYSIEHCTQGFKLAEFLAERDVYSAVGPCLSKESKVELEDVGFKTPVALHEAGANFCLTTDHPVVRAMYLNMIAGMASAYGVGDEAALRAVTLSAAEHVGVADRVGSISEGKDADLVIWTGDPLDGRSFAETVIIDGEVVYERE